MRRTTVRWIPAILMSLVLNACGWDGTRSGPRTVDVTIDGQFTGWNGKSGEHEWSFVSPLRGQYALLYLNYDQKNLYLLNDWLPNTTKEVPPGCFNYFQFTAGNDALEVRAYGDQHLEATLNGVDVSAQGQSATGFHSSPNLATPHTIFEFRLPVPDMSSFQMSMCDPSSSYPPPQVSVDPSEGCNSVDKLLWEPRVVQATFTSTGEMKPSFAPSGQPFALGLSSYRGSAGDGITVSGRDLGSAPGVVRLGPRACVVTAWSPDAVTFTIPSGVAGYLAVAVTTADGTSSTLLYLDVAPDASCQPSCSNRECGDDGCGGACGTCPNGGACDSNGSCSMPGPPG
jgi:hypothetical protein